MRPRLAVRLPADWDIWAFAAASGIAAAFLMLKGRGNTFYYDEWNWIVFRSDGLHAILAGYNNHLQVAPVALYQLLLHTVGLNHYGILRVLQVLVHLACVAAVFVFARPRLGRWALGVALPLLVLGNGWEYLLWTINIGFVASLALSICALLALDRHDRTGDRLACLLLVAGLAGSSSPSCSPSASRSRCSSSRIGGGGASCGSCPWRCSPCGGCATTIPHPPGRTCRPRPDSGWSSPPARPGACSG